MSYPQKVKLTVTALFILAAISLVTFVASGQDDAEAEAQIENAMSAAPSYISEGATIMGVNAAGEFGVLREGTNGWTCIPDWEVSPGNDPICLDSVFLAWNDALAAGVEPEIPHIGFAYMLQGGSDPSNTDPMAMEPAEGEDWITTPPHIMIVLPAGTDISAVTTEHGSGNPYVMWAGTPYQHLMIPVAGMEMDH